MANLAKMVKGLRLERVRAVREVKGLSKAIAALSKLARNTVGARAATFGRKKRLSAAARRRISLAQKARWARVRGKVAIMRTMRQAVRRKIALAQRARWAKARAEQKKAA